MKKIICFSYTKGGAEISLKISSALASSESGITCDCYAMKRYCGIVGGGLKSLEGVGEKFYKDAFYTADALIFVGAAGIAMRKTAPFIRDKSKDPAVIVVDVEARFVIPLLSGHIGGANRLAEELAAILGATAVITTATDTSKKFAVDAWAVENGFFVTDVDMIKKISSAVLDGEAIGYVCDFPQINTPPEPLMPGKNFERGLSISLDGEKRPYKYTLRLVPRCIIAGMGCRKNIPFEAAEALLLSTLREFRITPLALSAIATIDIKAHEPAFLDLCKKHEVPLITYEAEELAKLGGRFTASQFVSEVTGVDNVCERAAVAGSGNGKVLCGKRSANGVTLALAQKEFQVRW